MQTVSLGNTDIKLSAIVMGTWQAGWSTWTGIDDAQTLKAVRAAFDAGITAFDTATVYGNGHSERIVGQALAWVIAHENTCAIAGARNPEQVRQNAAAGDLVLDEVVLAELDRLGRTVTDHLDDNPMLWDS